MLICSQSPAGPGAFHETERTGPSSAVKTILDLNEHCWQAILDHIPDGELVRSERVCRGWQTVVHRYLREAEICFVPFAPDFAHYDVKIFPKNRVFIIDFRSIYNRSELEDVLTFLDKWGPCVVHALCPTLEVFGKVTECCPKLKSLTITLNTFRSVHLSQDQAEFVEKLERIVFLDYILADYDMLYRSRFYQTVSWSSQIFTRHNAVDTDAYSGFWPNFRPANLKSLTIRGVLDLSRFLAAVENFPELTDLNLQGDLTNVRCLLDRTPKLDRLCIMDWTMQGAKRPETGGSPVCALQSLRHLILWQCDVCSWWLEDVLGNAPKLQVLDFLLLRQLPIAVADLCRPGNSLTAIYLRGIYGVSERDVVTLVAGCPKLTTIDLRSSPDVSSCVCDALAPLVSEREEPLRLLAESYKCMKYRKVPGLIVEEDDLEGLIYSPRQYVPAIMGKSHILLPRY